MPGIISSGAFALSLAGRREGWRPVIGWQSVVTAANVSADEEAAGYPASNLGNSSTVEGWRGTSTGDQYLTSLFDPAEIDYAGFARHNLGSGLCPFTVEGLLPGGDPEEPTDWVELVEQYQPADDGPVLARFLPITLIGLRLKLDPSSTIPRVAVLKAGALIVLQGLPPGHQPIPFARSQNMASHRGQGGDYLGSVVTSASLSSSIAQRNLDPAWYRAQLEPFRRAQPEPFFFAWAPQHHPAEVGYCWVTNDPVPSVNQTTGLIDIEFGIGGISL